MEVKARWAGGLRFATTTDTGHTLATDVPESGGGTNTAATPMEMVLAGLAACTGVDVVNILQRMREPLEGLEVAAQAERSEKHPRVFTKIHLTFTPTGAVDPKKLEKAIQLSHDKYCSVVAMLGQIAEISSSVAAADR